VAPSLATRHVTAWTNATVIRHLVGETEQLRLITSGNLGGKCTVNPGYSNKRKFGRGLKYLLGQSTAVT
jgi:hypothetical protein